MLFQLYQDFDGRARCTFPLTPFPPGQGAEGGDGIASQPIHTLRLGVCCSRVEPKLFSAARPRKPTLADDKVLPPCGQQRALVL